MKNEKDEEALQRFAGSVRSPTVVENYVSRPKADRNSAMRVARTQ